MALLGLWAASLAAAEDELELRDYGRSAIPIVGYDDKSGWLFGAAGFLYSDQEPAVNAGLFAVSNLNDFHSATLNYEERSGGTWSYSLHLLGEHAFDHYYGEGDLTPPHDLAFMRMEHFEVRPGLLYKVAPHLRMGPYAELRSRTEEDTHFFPDEATTVWGLQAQWDTRDKLINTRQGDFFQLHVSRAPFGEAFSQVDLDLRRFLRLNRRWTLGNRFIAGSSLGGEPSFLYRYRLGGLDLLRATRITASAAKSSSRSRKSCAGSGKSGCPSIRPSTWAISGMRPTIS